MSGYYFHRSDRQLIIVLLIVAVILVALLFITAEGDMSGRVTSVDSTKTDTSFLRSEHRQT